MRKIKILRIIEYLDAETILNTFYLVKVGNKINLFYEKDDITPIVKVLIDNNTNFEMEIQEVSINTIDSNGGALFSFAIKNHKLDILDDEITNYYFETLWDYAGRE